jgi:hypothetical protein
MNIQEFYAAIRRYDDPESLDSKFIDEKNYFGDNIHSNTVHYLKAFQRNKHRSGLFVHWNWIAFLFLPIWMLYRRLYVAYIIFIVLSFTLINLNAFGIALLINIGMGVLGDSVYIYLVHKAHCRKQYMNPGNIPLVVLFFLHFLIVSIIYYTGYGHEIKSIDEKRS